MIRVLLACLFAVVACLANAQSRQPEIAIFLACECPISQKYVATLNEFYSQYQEQALFKWRFVIPGKVKKKELRAFIQEYDVQFPLTRDKRHKFTNSFEASVTPQVIIKVDDTIFYTGAIDNWFYELGQYRHAITENYMKDALEALVHGNSPPIHKTEAVGCPIAKL